MNGPSPMLTSYRSPGIDGRGAGEPLRPAIFIGDESLILASVETSDERIPGECAVFVPGLVSRLGRQ